MIQDLRLAFPALTDAQIQQFEDLHKALIEWNDKVNLISRKDTEYFWERHVMHSLCITRFVDFKPGTRVMDLGTGGGFPGLPLAIFYPEVEFVLIDSITKKIAAVADVIRSLGLENVEAINMRAEDYKGKFDFVVTRAVAPLESLIHWTRKSILKESKHKVKNGIIALKGGDLKAELKGLRAKEIPLSNYIESPFFETKKLVYWAAPSKKASGYTPSR